MNLKRCQLFSSPIVWERALAEKSYYKPQFGQSLALSFIHNFLPYRDITGAFALRYYYKLV